MTAKCSFRAKTKLNQPLEITPETSILIMKWMQSLQRTILAFVLVAMAAPLVAQDRIPWITDLSQARDVAQRQNRLVLLHFWSETCIPCKQVERQVFNRPEFIRALTTGYIPVKINANQKPELADFYNIERVPTDVIVTPEGREVQRFQSLQDPNQYIAMLDGIRSRASVGAYDTAGRSVNPAPTASAPEAAQQQAASGQPYGSYTPMAQQPSDSGRYGQPQAPQQQSTAVAGGYGQSRYGQGDAQTSPLAQPTTPQQQELAPRYANPFAEQQQANAGASASGYGGQPAQGNTLPTAPSQLQNNAYADNGRYGGNARVETGQYRPSQGNTQPASPSQPQNNVYADNSRYGGNTQTETGQYQPAQQANPAVDQRLASRAPQQDYAPAGQPIAPSRPAAQPQSGQPQVSLEGYCPVTLVQSRVWTPGDKKWGAVHEGRVYLFAGPEQQQQFLANPHVYAPLMAGYDPVRFAETGQLVPGRREFGLYIDEPGPIALFADEAALERFHSNSGYYFNQIRQAKLQQAGNPTR